MTVVSACRTMVLEKRINTDGVGRRAGCCRKLPRPLTPPAARRPPWGARGSRIYFLFICTLFVRAFVRCIVIRQIARCLFAAERRRGGDGDGCEASFRRRPALSREHCRNSFDRVISAADSEQRRCKQLGARYTLRRICCASSTYFTILISTKHFPNAVHIYIVTSDMWAIIRFGIFSSKSLKNW